MTNLIHKLSTRKTPQPSSNEDGFDLISLMVTLTIMMILSAAVLPIVVGMTYGSLKKPVENDVRSAADAVATYFNRNPTSGDIVIATPACEGGQKNIQGLNIVVSANNNCISVWGNARDGFFVRGTNVALKGEYKYSSIEQKYTRTGAYQTKKTTQGD